MSFEGQIQQWVQIDNQLKQLNDKAKELRDKRNLLEQNITTHVFSNNLSNSTVKISDGRLKFVNTKSIEKKKRKEKEKRSYKNMVYVYTWDEFSKSVETIYFSDPSKV